MMRMGRGMTEGMEGTLAFTSTLVTRLVAMLVMVVVWAGEDIQVDLSIGEFDGTRLAL